MSQAIHRHRRERRRSGTTARCALSKGSERRSPDPSPKGINHATVPMKHIAVAKEVMAAVSLAEQASLFE